MPGVTRGQVQLNLSFSRPLEEQFKLCYIRDTIFNPECYIEGPFPLISPASPPREELGPSSTEEDMLRAIYREEHKKDVLAEAKRIRKKGVWIDGKQQKQRAWRNCELGLPNCSKPCCRKEYLRVRKQRRKAERDDTASSLAPVPIHISSDSEV